MKKVSAYTLGCKVNRYDTTAMMELLGNAGFEQVEFGTPADVCLINTCTVTNVADKKSRNFIRRAVKDNPGAAVLVCGCLAQNHSNELMNELGVDAVVGTSGRADIVDIVNGCLAGKRTNAVHVFEQEDFEELSVSSGGELTRAYIKIQEGCDNFCSYCIIPYVRGRARSRRAEEVVREAERLAARGTAEIVLTGIHISSYNSEEGLVGLLERLNGIGGIKRIRLGSLEPHILTDGFVDALSGMDKVCPHFHVSLQSGSVTVLERMNRHYAPGEYAERIQKLRSDFDRPAITTDVITGFPGESEAEFGETFEFVRKVGFARLHVFPYSKREGTAAAAMPQIPMALSRERAAGLIELGKRMEEDYAGNFIGEVHSVLFEQERGGYMEGRTARYLKVRAPGGELGSCGDVLLRKAGRGAIYGELVKE